MAEEIIGFELMVVADGDGTCDTLSDVCAFAISCAAIDCPVSGRFDSFTLVASVEVGGGLGDLMVTWQAAWLGHNMLKWA